VKLGFLCKFTEENVKTAAEIGFDSLEVHASSWPEDVLASASKAKKAADEAQALLDKQGICISSITNYDTKLTPAKDKIKRFDNVIRFCNLMGVDVISGLAGGEAENSIEDNIKLYKAVFGVVGPRAADAGVKIAFENWPAASSAHPPMGSRNLAGTPVGWEAMFNAVDCQALGLEFDPSHLVRLCVDYIGALKRFSNRIYHVHAKDTEIFDDKLAVNGFFSGGWWRYRIPGFGRVDWAEFISTLRELGYDGGVAIEHEDPVFSGERFNMGLKLGYNTLAPLIQV